MPPLYLDNAASTRIGDDVLALMTEVMRTAWGNPSAQHPQGASRKRHGCGSWQRGGRESQQGGQRRTRAGFPPGERVARGLQSQQSG